MRALIVALGCSVLAGCFESSVHSGRPPGDVPHGFDRRWHHTFLFGLVTPSGPYDLGRLCPDGWSEVHTESDPLHALLLVVTLGIYAPETVTIVCAHPARGPLFPPDPLDGLPAPAKR